MNAKQLCRNYLTIVDQTPRSESLTWLVIHVGGYVLIVDSREECSSSTMEDVAERFGVVADTDSIPSLRDNAGPLLGCLIQIDGGDVDEITEKVRAAYAIATEGEHREGE